ncbi:MAG: Amidohydrolase [Hydrocarboniphaga sp.]|uniref:amidohydrolase family protein n=1 Tax=Hydrocarboniphaga sp. TaxID=2033016 RepID=UPI002617B4C2|nr:amidohydrolase family protein [Hydrocarboniphaga sp.]MDB5970057.1 Amidohydrolase [Hydrocarboniphaga sp.]
MTTLPYKMIDADQHIYETDDCFTRYLPKKIFDMGKAVHVVREEGEKEGRIFLGDQKISFFGRNPCDATGKPGALIEYYKNKDKHGSGNMLFHSGMITAEDLPQSRKRETRLKWLDVEGVEAAIMLPTIEVGVEYQLSKDPVALKANLTSYNEWLYDDWGFGKDGRLFAVPCLSLVDIEWAVEELKRNLQRGAKLVHLRAGPVNGRSPADPKHDPFWAVCEEAGVPVAFHLGNSGETDYYSSLWSENALPPTHRFSPFQRATCFGDRAIADTLLALITHNLFGRFPKLNVLSIEFGSEWVAPMIKKMDRAAKMCGPKDWLFGEVKERPRDVFRQHIKVAPYPEDDIVGLAKLIGVDAVLGGSDWPHPEGVSSPVEFYEHIKEGLSEQEMKQIMRDNTGKLLGLVN